jgi:Uncharacterized conserved protein (DUF2190)
VTDVVAVNRFGPDTYEVSVSIDGGQLVEPDGANPGKVKVCTVDSTKWLGVALMRAEPASTTGVDTVWGQPRIGLDIPQPNVSVAWTGTFKLTAAAALNFGDIVYPAASGQVQKATTTGRAVGMVVEPLGIASGAAGLVRLFNGK